MQARKREADKAGSYAATASSASALTKHAVQQPHTSTLQQHSEPKLPHERTSYKNNDGIKLTTRSKAPTTELVKVKELASAESNRGSKEKKSLARDSVGSKLNGGTNARSAPINPSASLPCGHSQITATAPVAAYPGVPSDDFIAETPDDIVSACDGSIRELQGLPPVEGMNGKPKSAFNDASNTDAGGDGGSSLKAGNSAEAGVQRYDEKWGGKGGGSGGGGHEVPREGRRRVWREEKFPRVVPSNVEVVEVRSQYITSRHIKSRHITHCIPPHYILSHHITYCFVLRYALDSTITGPWPSPLSKFFFITLALLVLFSWLY